MIYGEVRGTVVVGVGVGAGGIGFAAFYSFDDVKAALVLGNRIDKRAVLL